jgi:anti-anti-sigma regulatory factor
MAFALRQNSRREETMLTVHIENVGEMAVIECEGRIVRSEAAYKLRDAVISQCDERVIMLDLSEVSAIEGGGLGMLMFLHRWARDHEIRLTLFNPRESVWHRLEQADSGAEFDVVSLNEMTALLARSGNDYAQAA